VHIAIMTAATLALGAMNFGKRTPEAEARRIIDVALESGVHFIDTANVYNDGESERIVGRALAGGRRDKVKIATKVGFMRVGGKPEGLARGRVIAACDESLGRLATDRIDVYYLHVPDRATPIEETLDAIGELLVTKRILGWGVSNYASWQILEIFHLCDARGMARPVMSQLLYNLAVRQLEIEYFKFTAKYRIHTTVYNALAGGLLAGRQRPGAQPEKGSRFDANPLYQRRYFTDKIFAFRDAIAKIADAAGLPSAELAYAWLAGRPGVDSILVGPADVAQMEVAIRGAQRTLTDDTLARIDQLYADYAGTDASYAR
jgi:aryl-alcohol dehydrogenase-like predicted oxidoreductase